MKILFSLLLVLPVAILASPIGQPASTKLKVIQLLPSSLEHVRTLGKWQKQFRLDFWNEAHVDLRPVVMLLKESPENPKFQELLDRSSIEYKVLHEDFGKVIQKEREQMEESRAKGHNAGDDFDYEGTYHDYEEILAQIKFLAQKYPEQAQYLSVGKSFEGRDIPALSIGNGSKVVILENGIHAREWITQAFGIWVSHYLLVQEDLQPLLVKFRFLIVPMLNVDGFAYTHAQHGDRMWRKTRSNYANSSCLGADPNRNWDSDWNDTDADRDPCQQDYSGVAAFSEIEVAQMSKLILQYKDQAVAFFDIHSYSNLWMFPYGYKTDLAPNYDQLDSISKDAVKAIKAVNGQEFTEGPILTTIYKAAGNSADWVYDAAGIKLVFALELRGDGFILPADQIKPAVYETWAGVKAALDRIN